MKLVNCDGKIMSRELIADDQLDFAPVTARQSCADARHMNRRFEHYGVLAHTRETLPNRFITHRWKSVIAAMANPALPDQIGNEDVARNWVQLKV